MVAETHLNPPSPTARHRWSHRRCGFHAAARGSFPLALPQPDIQTTAGVSNQNSQMENQLYQSTLATNRQK
jgi:hypothetical protein